MKIVVKGVAGDAAMIDDLSHGDLGQRPLLRLLDGIFDDGVFGELRHTVASFLYIK